MGFGCDFYYGNYYGCSNSYGAYNVDYGRCCSHGWTEFGAWMMWIAICLIITAVMIMSARARQRRRMMYMEQMQMN